MWRIPIALVVTLFVLLLTSVAVQAAERTARIEHNGTHVITISDEPCTDADTLALIPEQFRGDFYAASHVRPDGSKVAACWSTTVAPFELEDDQLFIIGADGSQGRLNMSRFVKAGLVLKPKLPRGAVSF